MRNGAKKNRIVNRFFHGGTVHSPATDRRGKGWNEDHPRQGGDDGPRATAMGEGFQTPLDQRHKHSEPGGEVEYNKEGVDKLHVGLFPT